jgi:PAS domain S-box-containing protein
MPNESILVVEDEKMLAEGIRSILESYGYKVASVATSGEEAVQKSELFDPDLVLMDVSLKGGMDGIEAADKIRNQFRIPVVYVTAFTNEEIIRRARITDPFGYVVKPFEAYELKTAIEIALQRSLHEWKLKENENSISSILSSISYAVISTNTKGIITYINPAAERMTGYTSDEATGRPYNEILRISSPNIRSFADDILTSVIRDGKTLKSSRDDCLITKSDKKILIHSTAAPMVSYDESICVTGAVITLWDLEASQV